MTCRKVRKLMPLAAGDDLGPRRIRAVRAHVEACPACRSELEGFREALGRIRAEARRESVPDWSEGEWKALMVRAAGGTRETRKEKKGLGGRVLWPRWAAASGLGVVVGLAVLSLLFRDGSFGPRPDAGAVGATLAEAGRDQDVISMTMVSPESGLQIVWFFDKKFDWKGDRE